jgi:release factor glutamine methyltransferase
VTRAAPLRAGLLRAGTGRLAAAGVPDPAREARLLLRWAAGLSGAALARAQDEPAGNDEARRFARAIRRRAGREPLSHITGERAFWGRAFSVGPEVLDPRPETETLVAEALHRGPVPRVLDLGTGSGCLLVTLLAEWPDAAGLGTDISPAALAIARRNAERHGVAARATFVEADWTEGLGGRFDLVVSNPPYIAEAELAALEPEVREHEPRIALTPGGDGLGAYRRIAAGVRGLMAPGALLAVEIGPTQSLAVAALMAEAGLSVTAIIPDLDQRPRLVLARAGGKSAL